MVKPVQKAVAGNPEPPKALPDTEGMTLAQPDNPATPATQNVEVIHEEETKFPDGTVKTIRETRKAGQQVGSAQKDLTGQTAAQLASFKGVQVLGAICLLAGALCFFHPALRIIVGGKDTAMAIAGAGLVMTFGPSLFVSYEKYFFLAIVGAGLYWFWSRSKYREGQLDAHTGKTTPPFK